MWDLEMMMKDYVFRIILSHSIFSLGQRAVMWNFENDDEVLIMFYESYYVAQSSLCREKTLCLANGQR